MTRTRRVVVVFALALALGAASAVSTQTSKPRLVVVLVVDQMRSDYIDRYGGNWTAGLRRLIDRGARFKDAAYPYVNTVTCAGHATVATGAFPRTHGMVSNYWYDRAAGKRVGCTDDPATPIISYGKPADDHYSPKSLLLPTFADALRAQSRTAPKIVTVSLKERTAITLAGKQSDATLWFNDKAEGFVTSAAYTTSRAPFLEQFFTSHPITADYGKTWTLGLAIGRYQHGDTGTGELPPSGWTVTFPHRLSGKAGSPDAQFYEQWKESPFADAYLAAIAQTAATSLKLGQGQATDYLGISFSSLDNIGHDFGPRSFEIQDALLKLDATIGELLRFLDRNVGDDKYVVALTADHGVSTIPEQLAEEGADSGIIKLDEIRLAIENALAPLGKGPHVARVEFADIYFAPGVYDRLAADERLMSEVTKAILGVRGIAKVFRADQLAATKPTSDADLRAARLSYFAGRSGDMVTILKPKWIHVAGARVTATTHGTSQPYDARVPIILMGAGMKPGSYSGRVTPADIAPTLAKLCGIHMPHAEGHVLTTSSGESVKSLRY